MKEQKSETLNNDSIKDSLKFDNDAQKAFNKEEKEREEKEPEISEIVEEPIKKEPEPEPEIKIDIPPEVSNEILKKGTKLLILAHSPIIKKQGFKVEDFEMTDEEIKVFEIILGDSWMVKIIELAQKYPIITAIVYFEYCFFEKLGKMKLNEVK